MNLCCVPFAVCPLAVWCFHPSINILALPGGQYWPVPFIGPVPGVVLSSYRVRTYGMSTGCKWGLDVKEC